MPSGITETEEPYNDMKTLNQYLETERTYLELLPFVVAKNFM